MSTRMVQIECKIACFFAEMQPILATFVAKIRKNAGKLLYLHQNLGLFMKKTTFITAIVAIVFMANGPAFAQEEICMLISPPVFTPCIY